MPTGKITQRAIAAVKSGNSDFYLWDSELKGLGFKITPVGNKSFVFQYRMGGRGAKTRRMAIGKYGAMTPSLAREEAQRLSLLVRQGVDPLDEKRKRVKDADILAFNSYAEKFIQECLRIEWKASADDVAASLRNNVIPIFKDKPIPSISKPEIRSLLDGMREYPAKARRIYAILNRLFSWAMERDDIPDNVMLSIKPPTKPVTRDRFLNDDDLLRVWRATTELSYPFGPFARLLVLTGQRREEVSAMQWQEVDEAKRFWTIPAKRSKNGVPNVVYVTDLFADELNAIAGSSDWPKRGFVFTTTGRTPISGFSKAKLNLDSLVAKDDTDEGVIVSWRWHDLRRTFATGLQRLGIRFEVTESCLNHVGSRKSGVAGVYQQHDWKPEKQAAWTAWATHISSILSKHNDTNVVELIVDRA